MANNEKDDWVEVKADSGKDDWQEVAPRKDPSALETISDTWESFKEGIPGAGLAKKAGAAVASGLLSAVGDKSFGENYEDITNDQRAEIAARNERSPIASTVGNVAGAFVAPNPASIAGRVGLNVADQVTRADSLPEALNRGGIAGGLSLAAEAIPVVGKGLKRVFGETSAQPIQEFAEEALESSGLRVAGDSVQIPTANDGLTPVMGEATAPEGISAKVADWLRDKAELMSARAMGAERGTIKKLGRDRLREIGRHGLDNEIVTPFTNTDKMIAQNEAVQKTGGEMMGQVYDAIDDAGASAFNPARVARRFEKEKGGFWRSPLNRGETAQFDNTLDAINMRVKKDPFTRQNKGAIHTIENDIPIREAQVLKEELGNAANWKNKQNVTPKEQMARDAYFLVSDEIDKAVESGAEAINRAGLGKALSKGKELVRGAKGAQDLLDNKFAREEGNKLIGLTDTIAGAGTFASGGLSGAMGAVLGKKALERYGVQSTAVALDKSANFLERMNAKVPRLPAKYQRALQAAQQRGENAVAVTHFLLGSNDPEYRRLMEEEEDDQ